MAPLLSRIADKLGISFSSSITSTSITISATGGTLISGGITPGNGYRYHVFTSPGTFTVNTGQANVEYLVVAGGGGGGQGHGGGGGAGGLRHNVTPDPRAGSPFPVSPGNYSVTVGNGGDGEGGIPGKGSPSSFGPISSSGGGHGGYYGTTTPTKQGGSAGGAGYFENPFSGNEGGYSPVEGFAGGDDYGVSGPSSGYSGGGGGGAGGAGANAVSNIAGSGGPGYPIPAFAAPLISPAIPAPTRTAWSNAVGPTGLYGGGGGGGGYGQMTGGPRPGGPGGGGAGASPGGVNNAQPGVSHTGGGGGSSTASAPQDGETKLEGSGGPGIVIIRYPT